MTAVTCGRLKPIVRLGRGTPPPPQRSKKWYLRNFHSQQTAHFSEIAKQQKLLEKTDEGGGEVRSDHRPHLCVHQQVQMQEGLPCQDPSAVWAEICRGGRGPFQVNL